MLSSNAFVGPRAFARWALAEDRLVLAPDLSRIRVDRGLAVEVVLFREACWQIELVTLLPNTLGARHRHRRVSSVELAVGGTGCATIGTRSVIQAQRGSLLARLVRVDRDVWHEGAAGPEGSVFFSFQQWHEGEPGFISDDWEVANV